ncbi:hypothetical protein QJS10_CPB22g00192 [Acorus calamus]|uniref:Uncharacterized protein n=1 Tax=Acorus calamus TaxID=4465 RepID=A0AAV9C2R8_ACOCL|nr:hypothetical protein QJS10_CPB22g00192 [Acorus calamus]
MIPANLTQPANPNPPFTVGVGGGGGGTPPGAADASAVQRLKTNKSAEQLVLAIINPDLREKAIHDLSLILPLCNK